MWPDAWVPWHRWADGRGPRPARADGDPAVAVLIPVYKAEANALEQLSFNTCMRVLGHHPCALIAPDGLELRHYLDRCPSLHVERFDARFFESTGSYSELLLSTHFYERFAAYEYILIHQLDCLVFHDSVQEWCRSAYGYIGAPWFGKTMTQVLKYYKPWWRRAPLPNGGGNGGLSLRSVGKSLRALNRLGSAVRRWGQLYEDVFWGIYVPSRLPWFTIADQRTCARFAIQSEPAECLELTGGEVPFGCHGWFKGDLAFWLEFIATRHLVPLDELCSLIVDPLASRISSVRDAIDERLPRLGSWASAVREGHAESGSMPDGVGALLDLPRLAANAQLIPSWP